ncbi:hypothetical protein COLO4_08863 [Corchorus olitorius]|uniref:Uncharacterized protein n=1 Tax=Corchorus olitorius TaxID=93759 RepID=A0A1R3KE89_9ROSI|nr:hypothetical protein COLO4_08863 [Corchorus olitorius]
MAQFRPSYRSAADRDGRNLEIFDANTLKYVNKDNLGRSRPSFGTSSSFCQIQNSNPVDHRRKKKSSKSSITSIKSWWNEPRMKRKRRLAMYKVISIEGKLKDSLKKGQRWIKRKISKAVHGC